MRATRETILTDFLWDGKVLPVYLVRSDRRTTALTIDREGRIVVRAPETVSEGVLFGLLEEHREWLAGKLSKMSCGTKEPGACLTEFYRDGAHFPYRDGFLLVKLSEDPGWNSESLGLRITLYPVGTETSGPDGKCMGELAVKGRKTDPEKVRNAVLRCLRRQAEKQLKGRLSEIAEKLSVSCGRVAVKEVRSRWGSCSAGGNINLSWRLILMPDSISDYVMIHELCHRKEMNHSERFWREVERVLPDYRERRKWLRDNERIFLQL